MLKIILIILIAIISGIQYRCGGSGNYARWVRPYGVSSCVIFTLWILLGWSWWFLVVFGLQYASLTTYFKKKEHDATWVNWILVGVVTSLAVIPLVILNHLWLGFSYRLITQTVLTVIWSEAMGNDILEEFGRGVIQVATLPLLLV